MGIVVNISAFYLNAGSSISSYDMMKLNNSIIAIPARRSNEN
jgi:hypothetical protein